MYNQWFSSLKRIFVGENGYCWVQLSIVTGPVNSGKTLLLEKVFECLPGQSSRPTPVYPINLKKGSFHSVKSLILSLSDGMNSWLKKIMTSLTTTKVSVSAAGVEVKFTGHKGKNHIVDLNHLLQGVADSLPPTTLLRGTQSPILFID